MNSRCLRFFFAFLVGLTGAVGAAPAPPPNASPTPAPQIDPKLFSGMQWRQVGPFRGGRALAIEGVPGEPNTWYFGAVAGGVWKTLDGGANWTPLFDKQDISSIGAIAVAPSDHNTIYVGTGEAAIRGNTTYGTGVYKSVDAGKNWKNIGLRDTSQIGALIVHPKNPDIVLVAALGHAFGPNAERGIFRTSDGGKTWTKVLSKDENTGGIDVVFDPHNPNVVFASLWQARRHSISCRRVMAIITDSGLIRKIRIGSATSMTAAPASRWMAARPGRHKITSRRRSFITSRLTTLIRITFTARSRTTRMLGSRAGANRVSSRRRIGLLPGAASAASSCLIRATGTLFIPTAKATSFATIRTRKKDRTSVCGRWTIPDTARSIFCIVSNGSRRSFFHRIIQMCSTPRRNAFLNRPITA